MASQNAKAVARKVLDNIGKGKKVSIGQIAREQGYAEATARNPQLITSTDTYQAEIAPFVKAMMDERDAALEAMKGMRKGAKYRDLMDAVDKFTKNIQLLTGGRTGDGVNIFLWEK